MVMATPHIKAEHIWQLNFKKMKDMGMTKIWFEKDNVLTEEYGTKFYNSDVRNAFLECK